MGEEVGSWVRETVVAWDDLMWAACSSAVPGILCVNPRMVIYSRSSASCVSLVMGFSALLSICNKGSGV
jgi:hypothetical protein